jgi:DNA-binding response OmpR family regulator
LPPQQPEPRSSASTLRILIVEDEFLIAMELEGILQDAGFHVIGPALSVEEALERLEAERPDAAVLDVSLRGEKVTPVAEILLAMSVPFVLATAFEAADLAGEPVLAGAKNVGKPTRPGELVKVIGLLVGGEGG